MRQYFSADSNEGSSVESSDEPAAQLSDHADVRSLYIDPVQRSLYIDPVQRSLYIDPVQRSHVICLAPPGWI
jgi:hypothetical protein